MTDTNNINSLSILEEKLKLFRIDKTEILKMSNETYENSSDKYIRVLLTDDRLLIIPNDTPNEDGECEAFLFMDPFTMKGKVKAIRALSDKGYTAKQISELLLIKEKETEKE